MIDWSWVPDKFLEWVPVQRIFRHAKSVRVRSAEGTHFTVLVADLAGDDKEMSRTLHVVSALDGQEGLRTHRNLRTLRIEEGGDRATNIAEAEKVGRDWLKEMKADVLVWGEVAQPGNLVRLRFLTPMQSTGGQAVTQGLGHGHLEFSETIDRQLADILPAVVLTSVAPATESQGEYLVEILQPIMGKVDNLLSHPPISLGAEALGFIRNAHGSAAVVIGEQSGEQVWFESALSSFRTNLTDSLGGPDENFKAMTQNNLGNALSRLGDREEGTERLEEAVDAYRAALQVYTREALPLDWAMTQNNLGSALSGLGEREEGTERLEEAVDAYRAALQVYTREALPLNWAMTQNNLGNALSRLGDREEGTERLEEAVDAYRAALQVRTREALPLDWATTHNNLGNALWSLGEREEGTERLEEAVDAYRAALEVFRAAGTDYYVAVASGNLERTEALIASRRSEADDAPDA
jgi:tetratricopeptide (TPR) repeat protein